MPVEMTDPDDDEPPRMGGARSGVQRFERQRNPWWRPASTVGRVFLTLAALTVLGGLGASAYLLKTYLGRDGRFRIAGASNIEASGLTEVSRAEMLPVFGEDIGRNIFFVPLNERRKQLEQIPWVEKATVMRLLPDQIRVSVVERQPVAFTRQGQEIGLVDANGVLLTMPAAMMAQHHYSFPVVTGINVSDQPAARKARMAVYQRLLAELDANGQHISAQISEIDLSDPEDAQVLMPEQGADILAHFGEDHFLERYQRYKAHIAEWLQQYPKLAAVDLRYDQQVVLQMAPGPNTTPAATGEQSADNANAGQDKPPGANPANSTPDKPLSAGVKAGAKSVLTASAAADKAATSKPVVRAAKVHGRAGGRSSAKPRTAMKTALKTARNKAKQMKRAAVKRAALDASRQRTAPTTPRPATTAGMGQ
jgi:cell division protein FtsQ